MAEVRIDGVLYVPVSEAHADVRAWEDALVEVWAGDGWREQYPDALSYLRVVVSDTFDADEGETIPEFIARLLAGAEATRSERDDDDDR